LTAAVITTYYYIGDRLVFMRKGTDLRYVSQDHLTGTSVTSDTGGNIVYSTTMLKPVNSMALVSR